MGYLNENGVNKLWAKCKAKFATKEEVNRGGGNTTQLYKHELYVSIGSTAFNIVVNDECYFDLYTPQSTPYTTQALIENALKNYGGAIVGGISGSFQIIKISYDGDDYHIGVQTWQNTTDENVTFSFINDIVTRIL